MENYKEFLLKIKPLSDAIEDTRKKYNIYDSEKYNIFKAVSKQYKLENFHSDILALLIEDNLSDFCSLIKERWSEEKKEEIDNIDSLLIEKNIIVEREKARIDISIYKEKHIGIFIENKINNAEDQENQITNYYKKLSEKVNGNIPVVVYIPPVENLEKKPPVEEYKKYREEIKEKLINLPVIDPISKIDIVHGFLDKLIEKYETKSNETKRGFIMQYSNLLKYWGGNLLTKKDKKELLKRLLESENIEIIRNIVDVCTDLSVIGEIIVDKLTHKKNGFNKGENSCYIELIDKELYLGFYFTENTCCIELWWDKNKKRWMKNAKDIINNKNFKEYFSTNKRYRGNAKDCAIYKEILYLKEIRNINEQVDFVIKEINRIKNAVNTSAHN